uniref:Uncharacterized protein n=1 Tax=Amphimedon queenslandica TaxID=400682 RepID=A0A1X7TLV2_AMPQE
MHARLGLEKKTRNDPYILHSLTIWLETYMHWNDKLTNASLDETFKIIHPFYDFIDCSLIVDMSEVFLQDLILSDDGCSIVSQLKNYKEKADKLRFSVQVKHLNESLKTIYKEHIPDTSHMPMISIKLHNPWHGSNISGLSLLIHNLLPVGHQQSIMKYITISSGSVIIKYSVYGSTADSLIEYTGGKLQFMRLIGIFSLYINDHPVLQEDENMNFTFELALLEAVTAGNNEAVEFLLELETVNVDHTNEEGETALMLACERGHEDIVHSLLSAGANVNIQDNKGWTALMIASEHNRISIIHMLLQANANPHLKTSDGSNALMLATTNTLKNLVVTYTKPDLIKLNKWLEPLVNWQSFGLLLPGITQQDITTIEDFAMNTEQSKGALFSKWLQKNPTATWRDVLGALTKREEINLLQTINDQLQVHQCTGGMTII